ncbi:MAG: thioredoxin-dependent thiol peroxidase [Bryobacterales bacterium]
MLKPGDKAPDFTAPVDGGGTISLKKLKGKKVVLYFYPKDNTSGCTTEACDFRDNAAEIDAKDAVVLGVSPDSVKSHDKFKEKYELPFTLIADEDHAIAEAYGVWQEKSMYGRKYMGIVRSTFLIDEKGKITEVYDKVKVKGHVADVLSKL